LIILSILLFRMAQISKKRPLYLAGSLIAITYSVIVDYSNAFFLLPLFVAVFIELVRNRKLAIAFVIIVVQAFILCSYNYVAFGKVFVLSYSYYAPPDYVPWTDVTNSMKLSNMPSGLYGLLVSPSRGLFLLSPVTILGMATFWLALKERNFNLILIFGMVFSGILFISAYQFWHGGHCVGYRHILSSAMLLGMLSAFIFEKSRRYLKILCTMVLIFSMFTGISSFFIQIQPTFLRLTWKSEPADIHSNFYSELLYPVLKNGFLDEKRVEEKH
jgi:hypothetical protein